MTDNLAVLVKGSREVAIEAAESRRIPYIIAKGSPQETTLIISKMWMTEVVQWYCEPGTAPFPEGACLFYNDHRPMGEEGIDAR